MFDHAVLIDYGSTDRSIETIREYAPDWEIRKSKNKWFHPEAVDEEVMAIEEGFGGWKTVLNTTEFLVRDNFKDYLVSSDPNCIGFRATGLVIVDKLSERNNSVTSDPLVFQRRSGYLESAVVPKDSLMRSRLIHRSPNGKYSPGRHKTGLDVVTRPDIFVAWFGFSPMQYIVQRKLAIKRKIHPKDRRTVNAGWHNVSKDGLENQYKSHAQHANDLWVSCPAYKQQIDLMAGYTIPINESQNHAVFQRKIVPS